AVLEPDAIGRVGAKKPGAVGGAARERRGLAQLAGFEIHERADPGARGIVLRGTDRMHIAIAAADRGRDRIPGAHARLCRGPQPLPETGVMATPAEEAEVVAAQPRRAVGRDERGFDAQGPRAAQRIEKLRTPAGERLPPRAQQHARGYVLLERRL